MLVGVQSSLFSNSKIVTSRSFKAGTVRLLNEMVCDVVWDEIEKWIKVNTSDYEEVTLIGSEVILINYLKQGKKSLYLIFI
jgi:hypothetical protein